MDAGVSAQDLESIGKTRVIYVDTKNAPIITSICPELKVGPNEITREQAAKLSADLVRGNSNRRTNLIRRQYSRVLWELWRSPWESSLPDWLDDRVVGGGTAGGHNG